MRNRLLILPKPEKLNINEFLRFEGLKSYQKSALFSKNVENQFCNMLSYVKKCAEKDYTISFEPNLPKMTHFGQTHTRGTEKKNSNSKLDSRRETHYVIGGIMIIIIIKIVIIVRSVIIVRNVIISII